MFTADPSVGNHILLHAYSDLFGMYKTYMRRHDSK
jgi:hypothetical protein